MMMYCFYLPRSSSPPSPPPLLLLLLTTNEQPEGEDELKKMQLMELAIINGTFRTNEQVQAAQLAMAQKLQAVRKSTHTYPAATYL